MKKKNTIRPCSMLRAMNSGRTQWCLANKTHHWTWLTITWTAHYKYSRIRRVNAHSPLCSTTVHWINRQCQENSRQDIRRDGKAWLSYIRCRAPTSTCWLHSEAVRRDQGLTHSLQYTSHLSMNETILAIWSPNRKTKASRTMQSVTRILQLISDMRHH